MRSATFRNIALGILALAAAYHLGARNATAQAPGSLDGLNISSSMQVTGADGRTLYHGSLSGPSAGTALPQAIPGVARVAATSVLETASAYRYGAVLENGDSYVFVVYDPQRGDISEWQYVGNLIGGPTPTVRESFGALKSRYRGERGVTPAPATR